MIDIYAGLGWRWWRWRDRLAQPFRLMKSLLAEVRAPLHIVRCDECGHYFDAADRRGSAPERPEDVRRYGRKCPACRQEEVAGAPAWALWNGCQGVFACSVFHRRAEAEEALAQPGWEDAGCKVVPVRVFEEREDRVWLRECEEQEREQARTTGADAQAGE